MRVEKKSADERDFFPIKLGRSLRPVKKIEGICLAGEILQNISLVGHLSSKKNDEKGSSDKEPS